MGYTHYWNQRRDFTDDEWKRVQMGVRNILTSAEVDEIPLGNGMGEGTPVIEADHISFNGLGDDGHETCYLSRKQPPCPEWKSQADYDQRGAFDFCKTARKPYDPVVVSVLNFLVTEFPSVISASSDGADEGLPVEDSHYYP